MGPHLRERQRPGETHADAGPCWEDYGLRGPQPPLAEGVHGRSFLHQAGAFDSLQISLIYAFLFEIFCTSNWNCSFTHNKNTN